MKRIYKIAHSVLFGVLLIAASCSKSNFLDAKSVTDLDEAAVFTDSARTIGILTAIYSSVGASFEPNGALGGGSGGYLDVTDECEPRWTSGGNIPIKFAIGTFSPGDNGAFSSDPFKVETAYRRIRAANLYLNKVDGSPLSAALKKRTKAEARFLRGWYYAMLMKAHGGVQLTEEVLDIDAEISVPRSTYAECVDYVVKEMDAAAADLPLSYSGLDYGRATKGAALALKARILLYAASPLFNGGSIASDEKLKALTAYPTVDQQRWNTAVQAYQDVINLRQYQLETDDTKPGLGFYNVFLKRVNSEYIFAEMVGLNKTFEDRSYPTNIAGGRPNHWPQQNAVDRFGTADGKAISDPTSGYTDNNPYVNRDPRFYYSIVYNGSRLFTITGNTYAQVFTYVNNPAPNNNPQTSNAQILDNTQSNAATKTGYYYRKMCDTTLAANSGGNTERCNPLIRYAEVLLGYAEALNETGQTEQAVDQIISVRTRAGIKPGANNRYGIPTGISQDDMRSLIQNERSVELMFEEHRFWDVRRWKIAEVTEKAPMQGMKITKTGGSTFTYERYNLTRQHSWPADNRYYLMPYATTELAKLPGVLLQNPGW